MIAKSPLIGEPKDFLSFQGVRKSYDGRTPVVKNLNLGIRKGEFLTFLGPSGSGKTTTLMMLAGFEYPSAGKIIIGDRLIDNVPPHRRDIGMVFQNYALFPHMTVFENVAYPLKIRRVPAAERALRVRDALSLVKMEAFGDRLPARLSGGQQQRVALARALVFNPGVVLMDEPLGALDKQLRDHMQYEIRRIHSSVGCTTIYVTHDQSEAMVMSDRIAVFSEGDIEQIDTPTEIYNNPKTLFVASFIGENNILPGKVVHKSPHYAVIALQDGSLVKGVYSPSESLSEGQSVFLTLRPEMPEIGSGSRRSDGHIEPKNSMQGLVREIFFLGDQTRITLELGGKKDFLLKASANPGLKIGQSIGVSWSASDTKVFVA